ncbi:MAG: hypothetical protein LBE91_09630 [Tannerella sp.]|jgi:hypothetical protein|nr:hypothetical protein [Tannerella sp.]
MMTLEKIRLQRFDEISMDEQMMMKGGSWLTDLLQKLGLTAGSGTDTTKNKGSGTVASPSSSNTINIDWEKALNGSTNLPTGSNQYIWTYGADSVKITAPDGSTVTFKGGGSGSIDFSKLY